MNIMRLTKVICLSMIVLFMQRTNAEEKWHWQIPHAEITPEGDLKWKPEPFQYTPGNSIRYIDFENGDDNNTGESRAQAWKHHPWDPAATGTAQNASGIHTYVFKQGVTYRGQLVADESGTDNNPIRLTRDPTWGTGEARFYGSEKVTGTWQQGGHADMPDGDKVWHIDLPHAPRHVWMIENDNITQLTLARTPNWEVSDSNDVMGEWWTFDGAGSVTENGKPFTKGRNNANLTESADYYIGAFIWSEYQPVNTLPHPTRVVDFDEASKIITFVNPAWNATKQFVQGGCHYYLEDKPHYLDTTGEFWFDKTGDGGRLYIRLPDDRNPDGLHFETSKRLNLIVLDNQSNITISGLTFRFTNVYYKLDQDLSVDDVLCAVIVQRRGTGKNVTVTNCWFEYVNQPLRIEAYNGQETDHIIITDNSIRYTDHFGARILDRGDIRLLRNTFYEINRRPIKDDGGSGVDLDSRTSIIEAAGNIIHRSYSAGLVISPTDQPLSRVFVHHNKITDAMMKAQDYGCLAIWQGSPYVYSNIVGNSAPGNRWGPAYYLDGNPCKVYLFNNIARGKPKANGEPNNHVALQQIFGFLNTIFNNTWYKFEVASNRQRAEPQRNLYIGNLIMGMSDWGFKHTKVDKYSDPNQEHAGEIDTAYDYYTAAYSRNIFFDPPKNIGAFETSGAYHTTMESFKKALEAYKVLCADAGEVVENDPVFNAQNHDFRPTDGSPVTNRGAKVFVPFPLYQVIGEYNFHRNNTDPGVVLDDHWYKARFYPTGGMPSRRTHIYMPRFPLKGTNITANDYIEGPLEDWTNSALQLNGTNQYARCKHTDMVKDWHYPLFDGSGRISLVPGRRVISSDMDDNNFLLEVYFKTTPNHKGGLIISKAGAAAGYALEVDQAGNARLRLRSNGTDAAKRSTATAINDGNWHHVVAEVDRSAAQGITMYVDGKKSNGTFEGTMPQGSLSNTGDLLVGGNPETNAYFAGAIDFLRISRGNFADAKTSIEELHAWEFTDGPQHFDFAGKEIEDKRRDVGAFEGNPSDIIAVKDRQLPSATSSVLQNTVSTLKNAAQIGVQAGTVPKDDAHRIAESYADSMKLLLSNDPAAPTDTFSVPANGTYRFSLNANSSVTMRLMELGDGKPTIIASLTTGLHKRHFQVILSKNRRYAFTTDVPAGTEMQNSSVKWRLVP